MVNRVFEAGLDRGILGECYATRRMSQPTCGCCKGSIKLKIERNGKSDSRHGWLSVERGCKCEDGERCWNCSRCGEHCHCWDK